MKFFNTNARTLGPRNDWSHVRYNQSSDQVGFKAYQASFFAQFNLTAMLGFQRMP